MTESLQAGKFSKSKKLEKTAALNIPDPDIPSLAINVKSQCY